MRKDLVKLHRRWTYQTQVLSVVPEGSSGLVVPSGEVDSLGVGFKVGGAVSAEAYSKLQLRKAAMPSATT